MEIWKDIYYVENGITYDYRGFYQVSNWGRVKSLAREYTKYNALTKRNNIRKIPERILKPCKNKKGYLQINLCKQGKHKSCRVHRLVAIMFIDNPDNLPEVNHKDKNKENCFASNLEWCTTLYNVRYSHTKKINQYDLKGNLIKTWDSIADIRRKIKIDNIVPCCKGKRPTAGGYIWKYEDAS